MLISSSLFLLLFFMPKAPKNEKDGEEERRIREERPLEREMDKGVGLGSCGAADRKQKNGGPYLKSTIEIQDPYAKSAACGREKGSWKIGRKERLYIE